MIRCNLLRLQPDGTVDLNTPEVLEFSLKTSNQELNTSGYSWFDLDPSEEGEQWELKPFHNTLQDGTIPSP